MPLATRLASIVALVILLWSQCIPADPLLTHPLTIKNHSVRAEVANTDALRRRGLMFREGLGDDQGMIFIYPRKNVYSMWMKNTPIALSVAFIDDTGRILNIADMAPLSEESHTSRGPALYALEMRQGWFRRYSIHAGDQVHGLPQLPKAE
jgi:uncharacterized membrane protein (UPF0127 family)